MPIYIFDPAYDQLSDILAEAYRLPQAYQSAEAYVVTDAVLLRDFTLLFIGGLLCSYSIIRLFHIVEDLNISFEEVVLYFEPMIRPILIPLRNQFSLPFLIFEPSLIDLQDHIRECGKISLEIKRRSAGLHPLYYIHRTLGELMRLESFYYYQLGNRDSFDVLTLINHYGNIPIHYGNISMSEYTVYGISPTIRILKENLPLTVEQLADVFSTNAIVISDICSRVV